MMTQNRRKTPFRYVLKEPVPFELHILQINSQSVKSKPLQALLLDLSSSGCRLSLPVDVQADHQEIRVSIHMLLHEEPLYLEGTLKWNRTESGRYHYGVQIEFPPNGRDQLLRELRILASKNKIIIT
ncbi:PilZ domain-containing protein [Paenibacillus wulumuqiensis]|uniref:PilZ domain-containing protein n=1 Tax=Paenibacillus wulumuqiensis TaxID=1567107 RepID=UPI000698E448|nr:PilZ domain-containing protein [Paenibacillus wulumuqiensis]